MMYIYMNLGSKDIDWAERCRTAEPCRRYSPFLASFEALLVPLRHSLTPSRCDQLLLLISRPSLAASFLCDPDH